MIPNVLLLAGMLTLLTPHAAAGQGSPSPAACVAVMPAFVSGMEGNVAQASTAVRDALVEFLGGPAVTPVAVDARVKLQAIEEARQKGCSQFVTITLTKKAGGRSGLGRVVGQAAGTAAWRLPGGASVGTGVARDMGVGAVHALSNMAAGTRSKDEMRLEWTLAPVDGAGRASSKSEKAKASADGEDLLTPLVQRSAEAIVELLMKK